MTEKKSNNNTKKKKKKKESSLNKQKKKLKARAGVFQPARITLALIFFLLIFATFFIFLFSVCLKGKPTFYFLFFQPRNKIDQLQYIG